MTTSPCRLRARLHFRRASVTAIMATGVAWGIGMSASAAAAPPLTPLATEGQSFTVEGERTVRYGAEGSWVSRRISGTARCSNDTFRGDPIRGTLKSCELGSAAEAIARWASPLADAPMPTIDRARFVAPAPGFSNGRVQPANVADPSQRPVPQDIGSFREYCEFSHMAYEDPIVSPGVASAHLHTFLGNTGTNRKSTAASIAGTGNSTCAGGTLNRTSYWVPAMIDTQSGMPLKPDGSLIYYKTGYHYVSSASIKPFPAGLRMISGNAANRTAPPDGVKAGFACLHADGRIVESVGIPSDCPKGSTLRSQVAFPQCWDGVNLDSPDHQSHMAYAEIGCPKSHPIPLTEISYQLNYSVTSDDGTKYWRLSSDNYDRRRPGGYSSHADWYNGWDPAILDTWTKRCINASMDCHAFLIGDGRILY